MEETKKDLLEKISHGTVIVVITKLVENKYTDAIFVDGEEFNEEHKIMYTNMGGMSNRTIMAHQRTKEARTVYVY